MTFIEPEDRAAGRPASLRVADPEIGIDGKRVRIRDPERAADEDPGKGQRIGRAVLDAQRRGQRRLLRQQRGDRLIDLTVAINPVARADDQRRTGHGPPRRAEPRLQAALVGPSKEAGYSLPVSSPTGLRRPTTGATAVKSGATSRLTRRPNRSVIGASYSHRSADRHRERQAQRASRRRCTAS